MALVLPWARSRKRLLSFAFAWVLALLHWLFWAHRLEIQGKSTFVPLWCASVGFYGANAAFLSAVLRDYSRA